MAQRPNIFEPEFDEERQWERFTYRRARLGRQAGAERLGASLYELSPGAKGWTYHYQYGNEEMLIVISGRLSLRTPDGWRDLELGELASFPRGPSGAHVVANRSEEPARYLMLSEMNAPDAMVYPDSNKVGVISRPPGSPGDEEELAAWFRLDDQVDYWEGEQPLEPPQ
jgi:uncharacterized cupin superfamily protein